MTNTKTYGIHTTDDLDTRSAYKEIVRDITRYNQVAEPLGVGSLFKRTKKEKIKFFLDGTTFVETSEMEQAKWQKNPYYERAMPMHIYSVGGAWTDETLQDATTEEVSAWKESIMIADQKLMAKRFFCSTVGGDASGNYMGFWNGSTTEWNGNTNSGSNAAPRKWKNNSFTSAENHYGYTGSTSVALDDFSTVKRDINEHGYGLNGKLFMFVNGGMAKNIEDLAGWTTAMTSNNLINSIAEEGLASKVSRIQGFTMVVDDYMPDSYMFGLSTDTACVGMREPVGGGGLRFFSGPFSEYPLKESYFKRRMGMAVFNRGAGAVYYLHGSSYTSAVSNYTFED